MTATEYLPVSRGTADPPGHTREGPRRLYHMRQTALALGTLESA